MVEFINAQQYAGGLEQAVTYIHSKWGSASNYTFYYDAIVHSGLDGDALPQFYLAVEDNAVIGCFALITNDFISRHDLYPWFACLFVEPKARGRELGRQMMEHGCKAALRMGFQTLYLTTDHENYYEKYGWTRMEDGFEPSGKSTRIYKKEV